MEAEFDLNALPLFLALARAGSFTGAAERLGCNKSKISLSIKRLEQRLGVALVTRTTRQVQLTEAGERLLAGLTPLFSELEGLLDQVETDQQTLQGELRITAPEDFAAQVVSPAVVAFSERHPQLEIELRTGDSVADMVKEGIDLAIRLGWLKDSSLRATRLGEFEQFLVASPAFMASHGPVSHPRDLAALPWVTFTPLPSPLTWTFSRADERCTVRMQGALKANTTAVTKQLLLQQAGLSVLADSIAADELERGGLQRVLPDWDLPGGGIYAVYPPGRHTPAKVRAFVEFLRERL